MGKLTEAHCERCHGGATLKATWSFGSNYLCDECFQDGQAETAEVEAFEMRNFFGAYGLPERPTTERLPAALSRAQETSR